ncbi:MAG TPA: alpha-2-macroglobulin family protein [Candidatus Angelobacter sp.]|nr:alpha-2-macroglobulin family protein [Candidatus Angelobacter sp.]
MRARLFWVWVLFVFSVPLLCSQAGNDLPALTIEEEKIRLTLEPLARIELPLHSDAPRVLNAQIKLELLREDDKVLGSMELKTSVAPGSRVLNVPWTIATPPGFDLYWLRLRYQISSGDGDASLGPAGIIQLGRIMSDLMRIEAVSLRHPAPGSTFRVRVRVEDVRTGKGLPGVVVEARLENSSEDSKPISLYPARTDGQGYSLLSLKLAPDVDPEASVEVTARRGFWTTSQSLDLELQDRPVLRLSTDKPIYQPGQVLHMRVMALAGANRVAANQEVTFSVADEDGEAGFQEQATTSAYGIAAVDWEIPAKLRSGSYLVQVEMDRQRTARATSEVRISRYELPEFTVNPVADKPYYLPGQLLHLDVTASYLFGQPVRRGTVRIVRANGRQWSPRTKKQESDERDLQRGGLDSSGKFTSTLDLKDDFEDLSNNDYERYRDIRFAAYVTDLSTNRTEQKSLTVRLSKESIHLYVINPPRVANAPLDMYLTAAFPDGTPAAVDVDVSAIKPSDNGDFPAVPEESDRLHIAHLRTSRYGVAHLHASPLSQEFFGGTSSSSYSQIRLLIEAHDRRGGHGVHGEQMWMEDGPYFHVKPLKRLLQAGESIIAEIDSSAPDQTVFVDLLGHERVFGSRRVELRHGHAQVEFPYDPEFRSNLYLVAYNMVHDRKHLEKNLSAGAEVLFPEPQDLDLGVHFAHTTYKPGESALAQFRVFSPEGRPAQSALGILVYDMAVAERVRSDQEFGSYGFYFSNYEWDQYPAIGGFTYRQLLSQKLTGLVAPEMELLAEAILAGRDDREEWRMALQHDYDYEKNPLDVFRMIIDRSLADVEQTLKQNYSVTHAYPATAEELRTLLAHHHIDFDKLRDPWGMPYHIGFSISARNAVLEILSGGPGMKPGTEEQFTAKSFAWPFFEPIGNVMDKVAADYARSTGKYIRDLATLRAQLESRGIDLDALRDPWGQPYAFIFEIDGPRYRTNVLSRGPVDPLHPNRRSNGLVVWQSSVRYFQQESREIDRALAEYFFSNTRFPSNEEELRPVLESAGITAAALLDPWGNPYRFQFSRTNRYANHIDISVYDEGRTTKLVPVTQQLAWVYVFSYGPDNDPARRFEVAGFSQLVAEQSSRDLEPGETAQVPLNGSSGAISGTITDPMGAVIPAARVSATDELNSAQFVATSDQTGAYLLRNLPAGRYRVEVQSPGFRVNIIRLVPVTSSNLTRVDVTLGVGEASETVEVTAAAPTVQTTSAMVSKTVAESSSARIEAQQQVFTPRLRKYFPETLVWRPELVTDSSGKAELRFVMADNITSWKMSVIASTTDGQLGIAEKELRTFQPFFVDHEPPKILTQGDQIELPVLLRNYMNKPQQVEVKLEHASWFSILSASQQSVSVPRGEDTAAHFLISADHSVREGKDRVTAANRDTGDAVEHTVNVHPDGEEVTQTVAQVIAGERSSLDLSIPQSAILGSIDTELKIYPNLAAHVLDSVRGLVARPAGCGEQVTSIAFGSLLALQVLRKGGQDDPRQPGNPNSQLAKEAHKYLNDAYQQLLSLQNSNGGFPYWSHGEPDLALTAYILDFLTQASALIDVDQHMVAAAHNFIVAGQNAEGSWSSRSYDGKSSPNANLTALIAGSLGAIPKGPEDKATADPAVAKALNYLQARISEWKDPYLAGQYARAAANSGRSEEIARTRKILAELAHNEGTGSYWTLEANITPFYSWGFAGRIETTGLVVQALARVAQTTHDSQDVNLVNRGLLYLLAHKDRYGVWYSTHASVNVLRAIIDAMPEVEDKGSAQSGVAEILVNGKPGPQLHLPPSNQLSGPIMADISSLLAPGANRIEIVRQKDSSPLQAQVISTHFIPWVDSEATNNSASRLGESRALRLNVTFDHTQSQTGKSIQCKVEAERIGFAGYGMMLAEVGLPPGVDVDRESLQQALDKDGSAISQYDVLPDRVVFYIWPRAGGSNFDFSFKPRFAMKAAAAPSVLYDYYNPEAHATVAPARFVVR